MVNEWTLTPSCPNAVEKFVPVLERNPEFRECGLNNGLKKACSASDAARFARIWLATKFMKKSFPPFPFPFDVGGRALEVDGHGRPLKMDGHGRPLKVDVRPGLGRGRLVLVLASSLLRPRAPSVVISSTGLVLSLLSASEYGPSLP